uniref:Uncharacterized protein n=1 Tax=viral metagenome TaxID=1070528 RepID=A0A6C0BJT1_9ZZZZ
MKYLLMNLLTFKMIFIKYHRDLSLMGDYIGATCV